MIRVRIEAHPSVEPSKVVITVRAMGDGATLCASGMLILCARQAKQPRLRALFWTLFFFLSFFQSLHFFIFWGLCWCVSVPLYIVYLFRVLSYLSGAVKLRMVWSELRGQTCNIWLGKELKYSVDGSVAFIWASCCFANFRHVRELGSSSYNRSYTCAIITHQRHSNRNSKTLWCGVHYYYYYFPFTVSAHQVWIWLLGEDECFLLKYNPTSLSIFFLPHHVSKTLVVRLLFLKLLIYLFLIFRDHNENNN